jgi:hypothetical protein
MLAYLLNSIPIGTEQISREHGNTSAVNSTIGFGKNVDPFRAIPKGLVDATGRLAP